MKIAKAIAVLFSLLAFPCYAELVVIAHPEAPVKSLSKEEIARIFLRKSKTFPNGNEVVPLSQPDFPEKETEFFVGITNKTTIELKAYWARLMFTGKGRPPMDGKNDQLIKSKVAAEVKYIGFIDDSNVDDSVIVIYRLKS